MTFDKPVVVIDNGSYSIKAGFACDNHPVSMFRTLVGRPNYLEGRYGREYYDVHIGDDALENGETLKLNRPIVNGRIVHWDDMERIWHHVLYRELKAAPEDRAVMLATAPKTSLEEKIKCSEIYFEVLNTPAICIQSQGVLAMYGSGFTTGICVDIGYDTTDITPVFEGGSIGYSHIQTGLAGSQVSDYIKLCLDERDLGKYVKSPKDVENIKNKCVYVTQDSAMRGYRSAKHVLPSGEAIDLRNEAFMAGEMFFQPDLVRGENTNFVPLHEAVITASLKCDTELQSDLYDAVVTCGGTAMIPGIDERLRLEMEDNLKKPVNVLASTEAYSVAWLGGATFASLTDAKKMWVDKQQYEEHGQKIIRNKFF